MLKQVVKYTNYNGQEDTETLFFNINRVELAELLDLLPQLEAFIENIGTEEREVTIPEIKEILSIIKTLIKVAYGERSEDGKHFRKSEEIFTDFSQSAVYDAFVMSLFDNGGEGAMKFMIEVLPKDLQGEALPAEVVQLPNMVKSSASEDEKTDSETEVSADEMSDEELLAMPKDEFDKLVGTDPRKMNRRLLQLSFLRKTSQ